MAKVYLVEYFGDIERDQDALGLQADGSVWNYLSGALIAIARDFPDGPPDPEDDRIVIWELTPGKKKKAVWHFSGDHFDADEFGIPQGHLLGAKESLYEIATAEYSNSW